MWTNNRISYLEEMWGQKSASTIAANLGISKNAVIGKAHRMKLPPVDDQARAKLMQKGIEGFVAWEESEIELVKEMWPQILEIAAKLDRTYNSVYNKGLRIGLKMPQKRVIHTPKVRFLNLKPLPVKKECQWIEGDPIRLCTSDAQKCGKQCVYDKWGRRSPYCLEHTNLAWSGKRHHFKGI